MRILEITVGILYLGTIFSLGYVYKNILGDQKLSMFHGTIKLIKEARSETSLKNKVRNYFISLWTIIIFASFILVLIVF